jgi:outer membrane immunogenic protein
MRTSMTLKLALLLIVAAVSTVPGTAQSAGVSDKLYPTELALGYGWVHSNAPPGACGCFSLNGGNATVAWPVKPGNVAVVADIYGGTSSSISAGTGTSYQITMSTYTVGLRYLPKFSWKGAGSRLQPFGEVLVGVAHAGGSLVQAPNAAAGNTVGVFATNIGGGLDESINRRFSIRLVQADYLLTTFNNGSNNHQNNVRLGAGVVFHF